MAEPTKSKDLVQDKVLAPFRSELELTQLEMDKYNASLREMSSLATQLKTQGAKSFTSAKDIKAHTEAVSKANEHYKKTLDLQQKIEVTEKQLQQQRVKELQLQKAREKNIDDYNKAEARREAQAEKSRLTTEKQSTALFRLEQATREAKRESKMLGAELLELEAAGKRNSKEWYSVSKQYRAATVSANELDGKLSKLRKNVGENQGDVGKYHLALRGLKSMFLQLGAGFGLLAIGRQSIQVLRDFSEGTADMRKTISGTNQDIDKINDALLKLDTRTSVTELQNLAVAAGKLDIPKEQIVSFVEAVDKVFVALGDDLEGTAEEIGVTLGRIASNFGDEKRFGSANAIERIGSVINDLSQKSKANAAPIVDFTNRLAGVSSIAGIASTDIAALGALLDESGQSMEIASTVFNTLLPNLAKDAEEFAKVAGLTPKAFREIIATSPIEALKKVAEGARSNEKGLLGLNKVLEKYNIDSSRGASIVGILSSKTERLTELQALANKAFQENTSISEENNEKQQTLSASIEKLANEFDKQVLSADKATGTTKILSDSFGFLAKNMGFVFSLIGKSIIALLAYKTITIGFRTAQMLMNKEAMASMFSFKNLGNSVKDSSGQVTKFGSVLKGIGWSVAIGLAIELATRMYDLASGTKAAREQSEALSKSISKGSKEGQKTVNTIKQQNEATKKQLELELAKGKISKSEYDKRVKETDALAKSRLKAAIVEANFYRDNSKKEAQEISKKLKLSQEFWDRTNTSNEAEAAWLEVRRTGQDRLFARIDVLKTRLGEENANLIELKALEAEMNGQILQNQIDLAKAGNETADSIRDINTAFKELNLTLESQREIQLEIDKLRGEDRIKQIEKDLLKEIELHKTAAEQRGEQFDPVVVQSQLDNIANIRKNEILKQYEFEKSELENKLKSELQDEKDNLEAERLEKINQKGVTTSELAEIENNYQIRLEEIRQFEIEQNKLKELTIIKLALERDAALGEIDEQRKERLKEITQEINDLQEQFDEKQARNKDGVRTKDASDLKKQVDAEREAYNERLKNAKEFFDAISGYIIKQSEDFIAQKDKEISAAQKQYDYLAQLAANGNIEAKESLSEQKEAEAKAQAEKIKAQERIERIKAIQVGYEIALKNMEKEANPATAIAKTAIDWKVLKDLFSKSKFYGGTKGRLGDEKGITKFPGKDSIPVWADKNEYIIGAEDSAQLPKNMTTKEIVQGAKLYAMGKTIQIPNADGATQIGERFDMTPLITEMKEARKATENMIDSFTSQLDKSAHDMVILKTTRKTPQGTVSNIRLTPCNKFNR